MREYGFDESDLVPLRPQHGRADGPPSNDTEAPTVARGSGAFLRDLAIIAAGFVGVIFLLRLLVAALAS